MRHGKAGILRDRRVRDDDVLDEKEARRPTRKKFIPRRGPAKITWPLQAAKALRLLTGRGTLAKALVAYVSFVRTYRASLGLRSQPVKLIREEAMEGAWTKEAFRRIAEGYSRYGRKGVQEAKQKERISKLFRDLGLK
jgi:hypothetical protein